MTLVSYHIYI